jgi:co-chaperonin GroES (HSP10)
MKAVGRNLIIQRIEPKSTQTDGGLLLGEKDREDIRYIEAQILSVGEECGNLKENDKIFYDRHAGHKIEIDKKTFFVIKTQDVVVVL